MRDRFAVFVICRSVCGIETGRTATGEVVGLDGSIRWLVWLAGVAATRPGRQSRATNFSSPAAAHSDFDSDESTCVRVKVKFCSVWTVAAGALRSHSGEQTRAREMEREKGRMQTEGIVCEQAHNTNNVSSLK